MKEYDFYIVPTPIGNLKDITLRAIEVLKSVDIIAAEDMRVTQKLLNHYDIKTKCISYHKFNEKERVNKFLEILKSGQTMAIVSDAGTPLICDPGSILVDELKKNNIKVTSLPGANAIAVFLSQVPRNTEDYFFAGFLPKQKSQIENLMKKYKTTNIVFYESPNRLLSTLEIIQECRNNPKTAIGREMTKAFEEIVIDNADNIISHYEKNILKGEIAAMVFADEQNGKDINIEDKIEILKNKNFSAKEISVIISELYGVSKNEVYKQVLAL